jgi:hypothetical protein
VSKYIFFNPVDCCFLYKAKDLSAPVVSSHLFLGLSRGVFPYGLYNNLVLSLLLPFLTKFDCLSYAGFEVVTAVTVQTYSAYLRFGNAFINSAPRTWTVFIE